MIGNTNDGDRERFETDADRIFGVPRKVLIGVVIGFVVIGAYAINAVTESGQTSAEKYVSEYGGMESVYTGILNTTNCATLQASFDRAADNNDRAEPGSTAHKYTLGYMKATDERMEQVGCYG